MSVRDSFAGNPSAVEHDEWNQPGNQADHHTSDCSHHVAECLAVHCFQFERITNQITEATERDKQYPANGRPPRRPAEMVDVLLTHRTRHVQRAPRQCVDQQSWQNSQKESGDGQDLCHVGLIRELLRHGFGSRFPTGHTHVRQIAVFNLLNGQPNGVQRGRANCDSRTAFCLGPIRHRLRGIQRTRRSNSSPQPAEHEEVDDNARNQPQGDCHTDNHWSGPGIDGAACPHAPEKQQEIQQDGRKANCIQKRQPETCDATG